MFEMSFDKIYSAAINQNHEALQSALQSGWIDEWKPGSYRISAVTQLAISGEFDAVEFLLKYGASIHHAVFGAAIGGHQKYVRTLWLRGAIIDYAIEGAAIGGHQNYHETLFAIWEDLDYSRSIKGAALGGHQEFTETLLALVGGKYIHFAVYGAAIGGHQDYSEALIKRGASIDSAVTGAAIGGHQEYAEALLARGADINDAVQGAATGCCKDYTESLLRRGADIDFAVYGASLKGNQEYTRVLLSRGARFKRAIKGAIHGGHISNDTKKQIAWLSFYPPEYIRELVRLFNKTPSENISMSTKKRAIAISKNIHQKIANYSEALARTDRDCQGMLYLLMILVMKNPSQLPATISSLPFELLEHILNFVTPVPLNRQSLQHLGFISASTYIRAQLSCYQSEWYWDAPHKNRAKDFFNSISHVNCKKDMEALVAEQTKLLTSKDASIRPIDKFHKIVGFWDEMRTGKPVIFEETVSDESCVMQ